MSRVPPRSLLVLALAGCGEAWEPGTSSLGEIDETGAVMFGSHTSDMRAPGVIDPESLEQGRIMKATGGPQVIYVNFSDGTTKLISGPFDDATKNQSIVCWGVYPRWSGSEARARSIQSQLQVMMNDFNIVLAAKRPTKPPYTMIMVGPPTPNPGCAGGSGVAEADCNNTNPNNIAFSFNPTGDVPIIAQELGHGFGLGHNDVACDVMGDSYSSKPCPSGKYGYQDVSGPILGNTGLCVGSTQNSYQVMKKVVGAWPGGAHPDPMGDGSTEPSGGGGCTDAAAPMVRLTEPANGATVGRNFKVHAEATDDCGLKEVKLEVPSIRMSAVDAMAPFEWNLTNIGLGENVEVIVTATDGSGKVGPPASIKVSVKESGSGGGAGAGGGGGGDTGGGGSPSDDPKRNVQGAGCRFHSGSPGSGFLATAMVAVLWLLGRRRRSRGTIRTRGPKGHVTSPGLVSAAIFVCLAVANARPAAAEACGDLLLVLDRSSSMVQCTIDGVSKEAIAKAALNAVISAYPMVNMGLWVFPNTLSACVETTACEGGVEVVKIGPDGGSKVASFLATMPTSCGGTPTGSTMQRVDAFNGWSSAKTHYVLLLTDGVPSCDDGYGPGAGGTGPCNGLACEECKNPTKVYEALASMRSRGTKTFVVGFDAEKAVCPDSGTLCSNGAPPAPANLNKETLNRMADEGGAPQSGPVRFYAANDAKALSEALNTILGQISGSTVSGCASQGGGGASGGGGGADGSAGRGQSGGAEGGSAQDVPSKGGGHAEPGCACGIAGTIPPLWFVLLLLLGVHVVRSRSRLR